MGCLFDSPRVIMAGPRTDARGRGGGETAIRLHDEGSTEDHSSQSHSLILSQICMKVHTRQQYSIFISLQAYSTLAWNRSSAFTHSLVSEFELIIVLLYLMGAMCLMGAIILKEVTGAWGSKSPGSAAFDRPPLCQ